MKCDYNAGFTYQLSFLVDATQAAGKGGGGATCDELMARQEARTCYLRASTCFFANYTALDTKI